MKKKLGVGTVLGNIFAERFYSTPDPNRRRSRVIMEVKTHRFTFEELIQCYMKEGNIKVAAPVPRV